MAAYPVAYDMRPCAAAGHPAIDAWDDIINAVSAKVGVPPNLVKAHLEYESSGNPNAVGSSSPIGYGLMQITSEVVLDANGRPTYRGDNLFDPTNNIVIACRDFILPNLERFPWNLEAAVAAYNAGRDGVEDVIEHGTLPRYAAYPGYAVKVLTAYAWYLSQL